MTADILSAILAINKHTLEVNNHIESGDQEKALEAVSELRLATSAMKCLLLDE